MCDTNNTVITGFNEINLVWVTDMIYLLLTDIIHSEAGKPPILYLENLYRLVLLYIS